MISWIILSILFILIVITEIFPMRCEYCNKILERHNCGISISECFWICENKECIKHKNIVNE